MKMICKCIKKWIQDGKAEFNTNHVKTDINMERNCLVVHKIVQPKKDYYGKIPEQRHSKHARYLNYKDYEFCPFCGNKLEDANVSKEVTQ